MAKAAAEAAAKATVPRRKAPASYIALLRGINVGGHKSVKMEALRAAFADLGFEGPATYLQSGNVVFRAAQAAPPVLARSIEQLLQRRLGFSVPVLVLGATDMQRILTGNPFLGRSGVDPTRLHVTFLFEAPAEAGWGKLAAIHADRDQFHAALGAVYLHCPDGYGKSKLANSYVERALAVAATTRNWNTVQALCDMAAQ